MSSRPRIANHFRRGCCATEIVVWQRAQLIVIHVTLANRLYVAFTGSTLTLSSVFLQFGQIPAIDRLHVAAIRSPCMGIGYASIAGDHLTCDSVRSSRNDVQVAPIAPIGPMPETERSLARLSRIASTVPSARPTVPIPQAQACRGWRHSRCRMNKGSAISKGSSGRPDREKRSQ